MTLTKREVWGKKEFYWQINNSDYYFSEDKKTMYLFIAVVDDGEHFDVELEEENGNGSMWYIIKLDTDLTFKALLFDDNLIDRR